MRKFKCGVCGFVYEPERGVPESGIPARTPFEELPPDFCCPVCGADKDCFSPLDLSGGDGHSEPVRAHTAIQQAICRTPSIKSFRLAVPGRSSFKPGQYLSISLGPEAALTRYLSISSSPTEEGYLEVTKRITQSEFSQLLNRIEPGYQVSVAFPFGSFTFEGEFPKIVMLSGGIGITPLRSICRYVIDKRLDTSIRLLYSNRNLEEVAFKSEFDEMQRINPRFKVVYSLDSAEEGWTGRKGRIDAAVIREEVPDFRERRFYVCGPPGMVDAMTEILRSGLRLPESQIKTEGFTGY